jgi:prephenate dehydratase
LKRRIQEKQLKGIAAIASVTASEMYDLEILAPEIQTIKNNMTRFVIKKENSFLLKILIELL